MNNIRLVRIRLLYPILCVLVLGTFQCTAHADALLQVEVYNKIDHTPIRGVSVTLSTMFSRVTDDNGTCIFFPIQQGSYSIHAEITGFVQYDIPIVIVTESNVQTITLELVPVLWMLTQSLPSGEQSQPYQQTIELQGGEPPYLFTITKGQLPSGLTLNSGNGQIAGTPIQSGTFPITVHAADIHNATVERDFPFIIDPSLSIDNQERLPSGIKETAYSFLFQTSGGKAPYQYKITDGSLPAGLVLSTTGQLHGIPTLFQDAVFTLTVTDARNKTIQKTFFLEIFNPLILDVYHFRNGQIDQPYEQDVNWEGGNVNGEYTCRMVSGTLPPGLRLLNTGTWVITGTPTQTGLFSFRLEIRDQDGRTNQHDAAIFITDLNLSLSEAVTFQGHGGAVVYAGFSYDGKKVITSGIDQILKIWNASTGQLLYTFNPNETILSAYSFANGTRIITGDSGGTLSEWDIAEGKFVRSYAGGNTDQISHVASTRDENYLLTSGYDQKAILWNTQIWNNEKHWYPYKTFSGNAGQLTSALFSPDESKILTTGMDGVAKLWNRDTTQTIFTLSSSLVPILSAAFTPSGNQFLTAYGEADPLIRQWTWDGSTPKELDPFRGHVRSVNSIAFTPDGTYLISGSSDRSLKIWDASSRSNLASFDSPYTSVYSVAVSPDGKYALAGYDGKAVLRWLGPSLQVRVKDLITGNPIPGATITLSEKLTRTTDAQGIGLFRYLSAGLYQVQTTKPGYQAILPTEAQITRWQTTTLDINLTLSSMQPLNLYNDHFAVAETGASYQQQVTAGGGQTPYQYSISKGSLPTGLTLNPTSGIISGIPTLAGTYTFTIDVTDTHQNFVEKEFSITQVNPLSIRTISPLPAGTIATAYYQLISVTGGLAPFTYSLQSGALPGGFTLSSSGLLSGVTNNKGTFPFVLQASDARAKSATQAFQLEIADPLTIPFTRLNDGVTGQPFLQILTFSGGNTKAPVTWDIQFTSQVPGLALIQNASQTWSLAGTPMQETQQSITLKVQDQDNRQAVKTFTLRIAPPLSIQSLSLADGSKNAAYSETIRLAGGFSPYAYQLTGILPDGLQMDSSTGIISGTPTRSQVSNFILTVNDSRYPTPQSATQDLSIRIGSGLVIGTPSLLANEIKGATLTPVSFSALGGTAPFRWSLAEGSLPAGVQLNSASGALTGTPNNSGDFTFTLQVDDNSNQSAQKQFSWRILEPLLIQSNLLSGGSRYKSYVSILQATGGTIPYTWTQITGAIPDGLQINTDTGTISGTPIKSGTFTFTMEISDRSTPVQKAQRALSIFIDESLYPNAKTLPDGYLTDSYQQLFSTDVGFAPYTWSIAGGALPAGLTLQATSASYCQITGTPSKAGKYTFTIQVKDSSSSSLQLSRAYDMQVLTAVPTATPTPTPTTLPTFTPTPTLTGTPKASPSPTPTGTRLPTTPTPLKTGTPSTTATPTPTRTPTQTPTQTPTPAPTATPVLSPDAVEVYDDDFSTAPMTGKTDFDDLDNRLILIRWRYNGDQAIDAWHIYVRKNDGGYFYLGQAQPGSARSFLWKNPDVNTQYQFRVWGIASSSSSSSNYVILSQPGPMGYNLTGGSEIKLERIANPDDLTIRTAIVTDDLYHSTNLTWSHDIDSELERALALKWNPGSGVYVNYHIYISTDGIQYTFLGQTGSGDIHYFRFDANGTFSQDAAWKNGPQNHTTYWFQIRGIQLDGSIISMDTGPLTYFIDSEVTPTPAPSPIVTPIPGTTITLDLPGLPTQAMPLKMIRIPKGTFTMGSPDNESGHTADESPQHNVTLSQDYYLGQFEVTNAQFAAFLVMRGTQSPEGYDYLNTLGDTLHIHFTNQQWSADAGYENFPVQEATWYGARDFCSWLSQYNPQILGRLPTEAEWEYACRAGTTSRYYWGDDPNASTIGDYSWYSGNSTSQVHPIGAKLPNAWQLYDMCGNVREWCSDYFGDYDPGPQTDPTGKESGMIHTGRGGNYTSPADGLRSAKRFWELPDFTMGFRATADPQE